MADTVGMKALDQVEGSLDIMYKERRTFYLKENFLATLWEDATTFLNFSAQVQTLDNAPDPDFKLFEARPYWVDNFYATYSGTATPTLQAGTEITGSKLQYNGAGKTKLAMRGTVCEIWNSSETVKKAITIIQTATAGDTEDTVNHTPIWVNGTQSLATDDIFYVIGNAQEEGSLSPEAVSDDLSIVWNSTQIFEWPVYATDVMMKAKLRPVNEWERLVLEGSRAHKMNIERSILFNARRGAGGDMDGPPNHIVGPDGHYVRTTAGFFPLMEENYSVPSGPDRVFNVDTSTYTWSDFVDDMKNIFYFQENGRPLYMFHGADVSAFFDKVAQNGFFGNSGRVVLGPAEEDTFGFKIRRLYTSEGELRLVRTPSLRGRYSGYAAIVDPRYVGIVKYEPDQYKTNIQENDRKARKDEYFSHLGFYMNLPEKHAVMKFS